MSQSIPSLKLECQRVMQIIMRNDPSYDKQQMEQHNQCQIKLGCQIEINVDEQSKGFEVFYEDQRTGHSWMMNLINQLSDVHLFIYHRIQCNHMSPSQFINQLLATVTPSTQQPHRKQQTRQQFTSRQHEYVFFNSLPRESLVISSMQQIDGDFVMLVGRSFQGQIVYVSVSNKVRAKSEILGRFVRVMRGGVLHVVIDSIDYSMCERSKITQDELITISETTNIIYLLRETDHNFNLDSDNYVRYQIYYNSLLQKYIHHSQFSYLQTTLPTLIQSLLQYFFTLMRQELPLLHFAFYNEFSLIKGVIEVNYNRGLLKQQNKIYELKHFQDFIHSHDYISQFMHDNSLHTAFSHFSTKLTTSSHCYYCKVYKNTNKSTLYTCQRCQNEYCVPIPLCPECMEPFHQIKDRGKIVENFKNNNKNNQRNQKQEKMSTQQCVGMNMQCEQQKIANRILQKELKRSKQYISRLTGKSRFSKKISRVYKKKKLHLTPQQLSNLKQLQQSGQRLVDIFSEFKNLKSLYKPSIHRPINQHELKYQLKNQLDLMKAMGVELGRQIEMFEGQVMMGIYMKRGQEGIDSQGFGRMVKIEHVDEEYSDIKLPMVKIEQQSDESYDDNQNYNFNIPNTLKTTADD